MAEFLHIGFESYVNVQKVKLIVMTDTTRLRKELQRRKLEKTSAQYFDAAKGKPPKSFLLLDDGMIIVSGIAADTLNKRINEINLGGKSE